jgi:hypothetical protein
MEDGELEDHLMSCQYGRHRNLSGPQALFPDRLGWAHDLDPHPLSRHQQLGLAGLLWLVLPARVCHRIDDKTDVSLSQTGGSSFCPRSSADPTSFSASRKEAEHFHAEPRHATCTACPEDIKELCSSWSICESHAGPRTRPELITLLLTSTGVRIHHPR